MALKTKKLLSILLAVMMVVSVLTALPFSASAAIDTTGKHISEAQETSKYDTYYLLTEGTWYIDSDTEIDRSLLVQSGNVTLNLNGFDLTKTGDRGNVLYVENGSLTVNGGGATISGGKGNWDVWGGGFPRGGGITVGDSSTNPNVVFNDVIIMGNEADFGGGIFIGGGTLTMNNCTVTDNLTSSYGGDGWNNGAALFFDGGTAVLNNTAITGNRFNSDEKYAVAVGTNCQGLQISGNTVIYDNNTPNGSQHNILVGGNGYGSFQGIDVVGELGNNAKVGITMETPGAFTKSENTAYNDPACFVSDANNYIAVKNTSGQLMLVDENTSITYSGYEGVYDGASHTISVTVNAADHHGVKYGETEGQYNLTEPPAYSDYGIHPVYFMVEINSGNGDYVPIVAAATVNIQCQVSFSANGGSGTMEPVASDVGGKIILPENTFAAPAGKAFAGWEIGDTFHSPGDAVTISGSTTVSAVWVDGVAATFESGGADGTAPAAIAVAPGSVIILPNNTFTPPAGKMFAGWKSSADGVVYKSNSKVTLTEDIVFTAQWIDGESFENGLPNGWTVTGDNDYKWGIGSGDNRGGPGPRTGDNNMRSAESRGSNLETYLIMPSMDLSHMVSANLEFYYYNRSWGGDIDTFAVYYRVDGGSWVELFTTSGNHDNWTLQTLELPLLDNLEIGFYAHDNYGYGVALDDVLLTLDEGAPAGPNNGTNIHVADTISENFYLDDEYYGEDAYVTVNYNHNSNISETSDFSTDISAMSELAEFNDSSSPYDGARIISVIQAPAQSTEPITINIYASQDDAQAGENPVDTITYSVYNYCRSIITGEYVTNLKNLAKSTLDYAAASQMYFNYNTDNMATKDISGDFYMDVDAVDLSTLPSVTSAPACIEGLSVVIKSDFEIKLLSKTPIDVTGYNLDTTKGGARFNARSYQNGDYYIVHISGIDPANMDNTVTVNTSEGDIVLSAYSILGKMRSSGDDSLIRLAKAVYLYGASANSYFG